MLSQRCTYGRACHGAFAGSGDDAVEAAASGVDSIRGGTLRVGLRAVHHASPPFQSIPFPNSTPPTLCAKRPRSPRMKILAYSKMDAIPVVAALAHTAYLVGWFLIFPYAP